MNHLQKDIDSLESERSRLKENLKAHSPKKGDVKQPMITFGKFNFVLEIKTWCIIFYNHWTVYSSISIETNISTPFVAQELTILKKALHDERAERIRIQAAEMEKVLKSLAPIHVPQPKDNRINELEKDLMKVKHVR